MTILFDKAGSPWGLEIGRHGEGLTLVDRGISSPIRHDRSCSAVTSGGWC